MKPFDEGARHAHPLTKADWVLEIGGHNGHDSAIFAKKHR